jgi:serine/threonine-protein kinase
VPEEFETIILQLLEKDPHRRIPTAVAVGNRLRAMEHALSLETRVGVPADDELRLAPDDLSIHSAATGVELAQRVTAPLPEGGLQGADSPTIVTGPGAEVTPAPLSTSESPGGLKREEARPNALKQLAPRPAHFTTVSEAELRGATEPVADDSAAQWIKIGLLGVAVMALIGTIVYLATRPPTADELYERIVSAAASDDPQAVVHVDDDIGQFLALYGDDPRIDELQTYRQDIDLYRLQRRFDLRMRRASLA